MFSLTPKQQAVMEFIMKHFQEYGRAPLIREVQTGCQITSYKSVLDRLNALERKGLIKRSAHKHRGIKVVRRAAEQLTEQPTLEAVAEGTT